MAMKWVVVLVVPILCVDSEPWLGDVGGRALAWEVWL